MPDTYPSYPSLPMDWLVPPIDQPDYLDLPDVDLNPAVNLGARLSDAHVARGAGDDIAIVHHESGTTLTFAQLARRSDALADALVHLGVDPGSRVAIRTANRPEGIIAAIAVWKIGAVMVPVPYIARPAELDFYFDDTRPTVLITHGTFEELEIAVDRARAGGVAHSIVFGSVELPEGAVSWDSATAAAGPRSHVEIPLDAVAVVWHTGGTTGKPKGCYHTQRRFLLAGLSHGQTTGAGPGQRWAAAAPTGHALGLIHHTIFTLLHGATIVMIEKFADPANVLRAIDQHRVTTFTAITATWAGMIAAIERGEGPAPVTLRTGFAMWQSSSSSAVADSWRTHGVTLLNNFGSTAFAAWVLIPRRGREVPQGALGSPAAGFEIMVIDPVTDAPAALSSVGHLAVRGPSGLTYWRLPEKQRVDVRDGWTHVDDLVQDVGDAVYVYLGRTDFLISTAGHKVAPSEVENVLTSHESVREAVVYGLPDPVRQEVVATSVVVREGVVATPELRKELQDLVKRELSPYKYPRILHFVERLPRDHVGKVQPKIAREDALKWMNQ